MINVRQMVVCRVLLGVVSLAIVVPEWSTRMAFGEGAPTPESLSPYMNSIPPGKEFLCVGNGVGNMVLHPDRAPHTELAQQDGVILFSGTAPQQGLNFQLSAGDLVYRNQMSTLGSSEPSPQIGTAGTLLQMGLDGAGTSMDTDQYSPPWSEARWHSGEDITWDGYRRNRLLAWWVAVLGLRRIGRRL